MIGLSLVDQMTRPMNNQGMTALLGTALLLFAASGKTVEVESPDIETVVRKHFPEDSKGGLAVLVVQDKVVIHSKGYGLKNGKEKITSQTRMGLASVTKRCHVRRDVDRGGEAEAHGPGVKALAGYSFPSERPGIVGAGSGLAHQWAGQLHTG